jgi:hypothetical protein
MAVQRVTLFQRILMDHWPRFRRYEARGSRWASDGIKVTAPGSQIVECDCGGTSDDTVEIFRKVLHRLEALSSAGGTAQVVRLGMRFTVERLCYFFANDDASVNTMLCQYDCGYIIVQENLTIATQSLLSHRDCDRNYLRLFHCVPAIISQAYCSKEHTYAIRADRGKSVLCAIRQIAICDTYKPSMTNSDMPNPALTTHILKGHHCHG